MANLKMVIYNHSPIWVQNLITTVQGAMYAKKRYGSVYSDYLEELRHRDYSDTYDQKRYQDHRLIELISYAVQHSDFYKEYYASVDLNSIRGVQDIGKLPILEKEVVRSNIDRIYTMPLNEGIVGNTSGTTGTPMKYVYTYEDYQRRFAYLDSFKAKHGVIVGKTRRASFTTAKIVPQNQKSKVFWRDNALIKQRLYSGYHCKSSNIAYYLQNLNEYKPTSLDGLPSSIYELARYVLDKNFSLTFTPIAIFPTAETLLPHYRTTIQEAFGCPVRDQYASSEGAPFITECKHGKLHYNMDTGIIEVDDNGEMIVTCFETHGTPLIRYKIGDKVVMADPAVKCVCGSSHPIINEIQGRGNDYLISRTNGKFTAIYLSLVSEEFMNSVRRMQFIQNNIDSIEVLVEADEKYRRDMDRIIVDKLKYSFGEDMKISIHIVDEIPKEPSGKYKLIKNNLAG
jgi:phenylacetate-CoA ligase